LILMMLLVSDLFIFLVCFETLLFPLLFSLFFFSFSNRFMFALMIFIWFSGLSSVFGLLLLVLTFSHINCFFLDVFVDFGFDSLYFSLFIWFFLFLTYSVKFPLWPFHSWLPEVHVEATTEISVLLASFVLKVGFFGMYKFLILNSFVSSLFLGLIDFIILFGLFNVSLLLMFNVDYKKIIAFWSILHVGSSVLLFWYNDFLFIAMIIFCNFAHIISSGFMFLLIGMVYDV